MLNVPESIKTLYKTDGINKNFRVHFPNGENEDLTNKDIVEGSVKFTESVSSKDVLKFGLTEQAKIEFECVGVQNMMGMTIECGNEIDISSLTNEEIQEIQSGDYEGTLVLEAQSDIGYGYYRIPYGVFTVASCPRQMGAMKHRRVTGYSKSYAELFENNDIFNSVYLFSNISVDTSFFDWLADKSIYMPISGGTYKEENVYHTTNAILFNRSKNAVVLSTFGSRYDLVLPMGDVFEVNATCDFQTYDANGMKIVECINQNGLDLTYNKNGKKIYASNEDALRAVYPWFFRPSILVTLDYLNTANEHVVSCSAASIPVTSKYVVNPYLTNQQVGIKAITGIGLPATLKNKTDTYTTCHQELYAIAEPTDLLRVETYPSGDPTQQSGKTTTEYHYAIQDYSYEIESLTSYIALDALSGSTVTLSPSLKTSTYCWNFSDQNRSAGTGTLYSNIKLPTYVYENSISPRSAVVSRLELQAKFGNVNRFGVGSEHGLSRDNPTELNESMIEDLWWDEYDVEPIGKVTYKMGDTNDEIEYTIGTGGSTYEFGDNYLTKRLFNSYEEAYKGVENVNSYIDANFVPNIEDVPFVPVTMSMIGLPYLEAGDPLRYEMSERSLLTATYQRPITLNDTYTIERVTVSMKPYQEYDIAPYAADKGLNHFPFPYVLSGETEHLGGVIVEIGSKYEFDYDEMINVSGSGISTGVIDLISSSSTPIHLKVGTYKLVYPAKYGNLTINCPMNIRIYSTKATYLTEGVGQQSTFTVSEDDDDVFVELIVTRTSFGAFGFLPVLIRLDETTEGTYSPYENVVPIMTPRNSVSIDKGVDGTVTRFTVDFPQSVGHIYGGEVDFTNGKLAVTYAKINSYNGEDISDRWLSDIDLWTKKGDRPSDGAKVVYPIQPIEYDVTPCVITLSEGENQFAPSTSAPNVTAQFQVTADRVIETYMLNRELSGVQTLFDDIEANGGEVMGD